MLLVHNVSTINTLNSKASNCLRPLGFPLRVIQSKEMLTIPIV